MRLGLLCAAAPLILAVTSASAQQLPSEIAAADETVVAKFQAYGAQLYECKAGPDGKLAWTFREPIATLILDGKTAGRHYAGPTWESSDGSKIVAKAAGKAPGKTAKDVPWLKLEVTDHAGANGVLSNVSTVQRIDTKGGNLSGSCKNAGTFFSAPYSAEYVMLRKGS